MHLNISLNICEDTIMNYDPALLWTSALPRTVLHW